ncbi:uncharacterized protein LOC132562600 [Ylistrum balloti]|uniref:uncharacterized protein LOC132562600 n=1 Tax=Ylistrum balloti TaxID=509963 RepID=UPI002905E14D|nr:uncharacterized protein LOC132562600 [Ylistrum balloti]
MASHDQTTSSDFSNDAGMPTALNEEQKHHVANFVAKIIQSSFEIIKQEEDLLNFLDEALEGLGDEYTDEDDKNTEQNVYPKSNTMTSVAPMPIPVCQLNGEPMPDCDEDTTKDQSVPTEQPVSSEPREDMNISVGAEIPDLSLMHTDGSKQNISAYIQDIIREAHEKVTTNEEAAPLATAESSMQDDVTLAGSYYTDDSPSKVSRNATNSDNKEEEKLSNSVVEVPVSDVPTKEVIVNNNENEKSPLAGDLDEIVEIEDESFGQQSFVEMNSKDRGHTNKKTKNRLSRIKDSILDLFSCTSSRSTNTS